MEANLNVPPDGGELIQDADSPTSAPDGGKVRPWEAIGMSRATWYRRGKPTTKPTPLITQAQIAKMFGSSVRSMQRISRASRLAGEAIREIEKRPGISIAAIEREAIYAYVQQCIDAATSEDDRLYFKAIHLALRSKHNERRDKTEQMKRLWRRASESDREKFIDWLQNGCRDDDDDDNENE
jgi:hypothetical protein